MNANEEYEIKAHAFYLMTGFMAPGKDAPIGMEASPEDRMKEWTRWLRIYGRCVSAMIDSMRYIND